jgi:4'-phosphopantetheinyl transferase
VAVENPGIVQSTVYCSRTKLQVAPTLTPELEAYDVHLWYATTAQLRPYTGPLGTTLNNEETARAERYVKDQDAERYSLGHGFLRWVLSHYMPVPPQDITYARGPYGKPTLPAGNVQFNFSDTRDAFLVAVAKQEVGADLEVMDRQVDHETVAEHYFSTDEVLAIRIGEAPKRIFLELWTRKEAVLKACGVGIMEDLRNLHVHDARNPLKVTHEGFRRMAFPEFHVVSFALGEDHLASFASGRPLRPMGYSFQYLGL